MKSFLKFILYLMLSIFDKKHDYIIFTPDLTIFNFFKVLVYDKIKKVFFSYRIRNKYDYITINEIYFHQSYEVKKFKFFEKIEDEINNKNLLIVDCGSNIGCSTNFFLRNYENSKVISIEPDKENFELLNKNIYDSERVELINSAVSNKVINFKVIDDPNNSNDYRGKNLKETSNINSLQSITINQILFNKENKNFYPYLIKIDIEGHEKQLFESNTEWIDHFKIIIIETHDWMLPETSNSKNFFKQISASMDKYDRDIIIKGENLISIKYR